LDTSQYRNEVASGLAVDVNISKKFLFAKLTRRYRVTVLTFFQS
jgi:hypothetical protein